MSSKLYVGNLSFAVTDDELRHLFESQGTVRSAQVILDRESGRSRGFGFVEMGSEQEAQAAIEALDGHEANGRRLAITEARPRTERGRESRPAAGSAGGWKGNGGGYGSRRF
jgi:RNA recognition motif-containing protein